MRPGGLNAFVSRFPRCARAFLHQAAPRTRTVDRRLPSFLERAGLRQQPLAGKSVRRDMPRSLVPLGGENRSSAAVKPPPAPSTTAATLFLASGAAGALLPLPAKSQPARWALSWRRAHLPHPVCSAAAAGALSRPLDQSAILVPFGSPDVVSGSTRSGPKFPFPSSPFPCSSGPRPLFPSAPLRRGLIHSCRHA